MEGLSVATSALQVASIALSILAQLSTISSGIRASSYQSPKKVLDELPVLQSLLEEINKSTLHSRTAPTQSVTLALEICVDRWKDLMDCLLKMGIDTQTGLPSTSRRKRLHHQIVQVILHMDTGQLQEATRRFRSALTLLRDIAMDLRTHDLLAQQRDLMEFGFGILNQTIIGENRNRVEFTLDTGMEAVDDPPFAGRLRFGTGSSLFNVAFCLDTKDGGHLVFHPARAKFDTGCPDNLISNALVWQRGLQEWQEAIPTRTYTGIGGFQVQSSFQLRLNWSADNETLTRRDIFYVVPESPFELLVGETFIKANKNLFNRTMHTSFPVRLEPRDNETKAKENKNSKEDDKIQGTDLTRMRKAAASVAKAAKAVVPVAGSNGEVQPSVVSNKTASEPISKNASENNGPLIGASNGEQQASPIPVNRTLQLLESQRINGGLGISHVPTQSVGSAGETGPVESSKTASQTARSKEDFHAPLDNASATNHMNGGQDQNGECLRSTLEQKTEQVASDTPTTNESSTNPTASSSSGQDIQNEESGEDTCQEAQVNGSLVDGLPNNQGALHPEAAPRLESQNVTLMEPHRIEILSR